MVQVSFATANLHKTNLLNKTNGFGGHRYCWVRSRNLWDNKSFCIPNELCQFRYSQSIRCIEFYMYSVDVSVSAPLPVPLKWQHIVFTIQFLHNDIIWFRKHVHRLPSWRKFLTDLSSWTVTATIVRLTRKRNHFSNHCWQVPVFLF